MTFRFDNPTTVWRSLKDLRQIDDGTLDVSSVLTAAPILSAYNLVIGGSHALSGQIHGHPRPQDENKDVASELFFLDPRLGFARTMNPWYQLRFPGLGALMRGGRVTPPSAPILPNFRIDQRGQPL